MCLTVCFKLYYNMQSTHAKTYSGTMYNVQGKDEGIGKMV